MTQAGGAGILPALNRIEKRFANLKAQGKHAVIPFTVLGWPDRETSLSIIKTMIASGASALELGIAFSDPVADGPTIQKADFETLESGFTVGDAISLIKDARSIDGEIPIGLLVYYNIVLAHGIELFFAHVKEAGADSVLIADLPVEAADEVLPFSTKYGIKLIFIVSPLTSEKRLASILSKAGGFLYLVSRLGVTGTHERDVKKDAELKQLIDNCKKRSSLPICAGFGISSAADAHNMIKLGLDGVITGSKVIELIRAQSPPSCYATLTKYLSDLSKAADS